MTNFELILLSLVFIAFILYCWTLRAAKGKPKEIKPQKTQTKLVEYKEKVEPKEEEKETEPEMVEETKKKKKPEKREHEKKEEEVELLS